MSSKNPSEFVFKDTLPVAPLKICALASCRELAEKVNRHIIHFRQHDTEELLKSKHGIDFRGYDRDTYLLDSSCPRFGSGEAKGMINESVRGTDLFILVDVVNYSLTYRICGQINHMSPDDHYQDLKRIVAASVGAARRVNVVMPFLYEGRQYWRSQRESLDCAMALQELVDMGVVNIITFDANDPRIQNAIPLHGFDNFIPPYQFVKAIFRKDRHLTIDSDHLIVISPNESAMSRAVYFANNLGVDMGMFYKRKDYSASIAGKHPIVAYEFLGSSVKDKTVIVIDDVISSGDSMLETARELKSRKARKIIICCTFGLFTDGFEKFDDFHAKGYFDYVVTTNLNYRPAELLERDWYIEADMSKFLAAIINTLNHDQSTSGILEPTERIQNRIARYNEESRKEFEQLTLDLR